MFLFSVQIRWYRRLGIYVSTWSKWMQRKFVSSLPFRSIGRSEFVKSWSNSLHNGRWKPRYCYTKGNVVNCWRLVIISNFFSAWSLCLFLHLKPLNNATLQIMEKIFWNWMEKQQIPLILNIISFHG